MVFALLLGLLFGMRFVRLSPSFRVVFKFGLLIDLLHFGLINGLEMDLLCNVVDYIHISNSQLMVKDCWLNGAWNIDFLYTTFDSNIRSFIKDILIPLQSSLAYCWVWLPSLTGAYSASSTYSWLIDNRLLSDSFSQCQGWKIKAPFKVSFLICLALLDCLLINDVCFKRGLAASSLCPRCNLRPKATLHYLHDCIHSKKAWLLVDPSFSPNFFTLNIHDGLSASF